MHITNNMRFCSVMIIKVEFFGQLTTTNIVFYILLFMIIQMCNDILFNNVSSNSIIQQEMIHIFTIMHCLPIGCFVEPKLLPIRYFHNLKFWPGAFPLLQSLESCGLSSVQFSETTNFTFW